MNISKNKAKFLILICVFHFLPSLFLIIIVYLGSHFLGPECVLFFFFRNCYRIFLFFLVAFLAESGFLSFNFLVFFYKFPPLSSWYRCAQHKAQERAKKRKKNVSKKTNRVCKSSSEVLILIRFNFLFVFSLKMLDDYCYFVMRPSHLLPRARRERHPC